MPEFEEFIESLPDVLGDSYNDSDGQPTKTFDDVKDFAGLAKMALDSKRSASRRLDNVIQKPGDNATDEEKAAYKVALGQAIGAGEKSEDYEFFHADSKGLPEGWNYNAETEKAISELALKHNVPKAFLKEASEAMHNAQLADYQKAVAAQQVATDKAFNDEANALRVNDKWLGDATPKNLRMVLTTIENFGSDELKAKVKEAGLYDKASIDQLKDWEKAGVPIQNIPFLLNVGMKLQGGQLPKGSPDGGGGNESDYAKNKRLHPNRPELWGKE